MVVSRTTRERIAWVKDIMETILALNMHSFPVVKQLEEFFCCPHDSQIMSFRKNSTGALRIPLVSIQPCVQISTSKKKNYKIFSLVGLQMQMQSSIKYQVDLLQ